MKNDEQTILTVKSQQHQTERRSVSRKAGQSWDLAPIKVKSPNMIKSTITAVLDCDKV